jgi:HK97 family phage prohead protease
MSETSGKSHVEIFDPPESIHERRLWAPVEELRLIEKEGEPTTVEGLAAPYGRLSEDLGGFQERIMPGAFDEVLASDRDLRVDVEHDPTKLLARTSRGTAAFNSGDDGLHVRFQLPDTSLGRDVATSVRIGNLDGLSIAWLREGTEDRRLEEDGRVIREVTRAPLTGVTLTFRPAYRQTVDSLVIRSMLGDSAESEEDEKGKAEVANLLELQDLALMESQRDLTEATDKG